MISFKPTINRDGDHVLKSEKVLGCANNFTAEFYLDRNQEFQRTDVIVHDRLLKSIPADDLKKWAIVSTTYKLKEDNSDYEALSTYARPLDNFSEEKNNFSIFDKRFIVEGRSRVSVSLRSLDPENKPEQTSLEKLKKVFGDLPPIVIKTAIW